MDASQSSTHDSAAGMEELKRHEKRITKLEELKTHEKRITKLNKRQHCWSGETQEA